MEYALASDMTYTFTTVNAEHLSTSYGYHRFVVEADSKAEARDKVSKLTKLALTLTSVTETTDKVDELDQD